MLRYLVTFARRSRAARISSWRRTRNGDQGSHANGNAHYEVAFFGQRCTTGTGQGDS
jgi:hypothetical protein